MTACTNHGGKARRVVTAALVGVLSVGTVPMVALAEGVSDGIETLVAGDVEDVAAGKITGYTDQDGKAVSSTEFKVSDKGEAQYLIPTEVTTKTGQVLKVDGTNVLYGYYKVDPVGGTETIDGNKVKWLGNEATAKSSMTSQGVYYVAVYNKDGSGTDEVTALKFSIVNKKLDGAVITDGANVNDTTIEYTGIDQHTTLGIALNGKLLEYGAGNDFLVEFYAAGATTPLQSQEVIGAGDYIARVTGQGDYEGSIVDIPFTVEKLDLSTAAVEVDNANAVVNTAAPQSVTKAGELDSRKLSTLVKLTFVSSTNGSLAPNTTQGAYIYKVEAANPADPNIVNSAEVTVVRYGKAATFTYDGKAFPTSTLTDFDATKISVKGDKSELDYELIYTKDGKVVTADEAKTPGTYTVKVIAKDSTYNYGGEDEITYTVSAKQINGKDVFVTFNGKVTGDELEVTYNGTDFLSALKIEATDANGDPVPDGELAFEASLDGEPVDEVVNAGLYDVKVVAKEGSMYTLVDGDTFKIDVQAVTPDNAILGGTVTDRNGDSGSFLPYTGSVIEPTWTFVDEDGNVLDIPADAWKVSYDKEVKEAGPYTATFSNTVGTVNYDLSNLEVGFNVGVAKSFADVKTGSWYVAPVYQAKENGYVNGLKGTQLFNPEADITRADAVCIIYNMAGGKKVENMLPSEKEAWTSKVTFTDVDTDQYFGVAIGWAESLGIANGFNGEFRPYDTINREEFAALLSNYAKATGDFEAVDADAVLGSATDYSAWAKDVVAWAKANGVMGNGGYIDGTGSITRAEVAAMAVNYQPSPIA